MEEITGLELYWVAKELAEDITVSICGFPVMHTPDFIERFGLALNKLAN